MKIEKARLPGVYIIRYPAREDIRGSFLKVFNKELFENAGIHMKTKETYYSVSHKNVLRGLHFQKPPFDHAKLVHCVRGQALDAVVDIRKGSPSYGRHELFSLSSEEPVSVYIPSGFAHGFLALRDDLIMLYQTSSVYNEEADSGILWNSAGIDWGIHAPVLSERDRAFPALSEYISDFEYAEGAQ